jgi:hypothetical protein
MFQIEHPPRFSFSDSPEMPALEVLYASSAKWSSWAAATGREVEAAAGTAAELTTGSEAAGMAHAWANRAPRARAENATILR